MREINGSKRSCLTDVFSKSVLKRSGYICAVCGTVIGQYDHFEIHHIKAKAKGGSDKIDNYLPLHWNCHKQVTHTKSPERKAEFKAKGIVIE